MGRKGKLVPNIRENKFAKAYLAHGNKRQALKESGYTASTANAQYSKANKVLNRPVVQEIIKKAADKMEKEGIYSLKIAMQEALDAIEFARSTENANAYVKAVELRSKLNGLLIEKVQHSGEGFNLIINGVNTPKPAIDVTSTEVKQLEDKKQLEKVEEKEKEEEEAVVIDDDLLG